MAEPWVSVGQIAEHLGVRRDSIYRWVDAKGLPAHRIGRLWKFKVSEVDDWVRKLVSEGYVEVSEKIRQLKMVAPDGKQRLTDCANTETLFRSFSPFRRQRWKGWPGSASMPKADWDPPFNGWRPLRTW